MTGVAHLVPEKTLLSQRIAFDNVPAAELGSLLLTLLPGLVLPRTEGRDHARYLLRLGGGKPLGLGSCAVRVTELRWWDAAGRYTGQSPTVQTPQEFVTPDIRSQVARLAGRPVLRHWPALSRILRADGVRPELIWYPLGGEWNDDRHRDESFRFFAQSDGRFLKNRRVPIVALPDPARTGDDQHLSMPPRRSN
jgi:hypothetical protein